MLNELRLIEEAQRDGILRFVVGAVILYDSRVLLLERTQDDFLGGIFEIPGGKVEGGESLEGALHREVREETGLWIKQITDYLGQVDYRSRTGRPTRMFCFKVSVFTPFEIVLKEHNSYVWVLKREMDRYSVTDEVREIINLALLPIDDSLG